MEEAQQSFSSAQEMRLFVNCKNVAAQNFYLHVGFERVAEVPVKMGDYHFTDYIYRRSLDDPS